MKISILFIPGLLLSLLAGCGSVGRSESATYGQTPCDVAPGSIACFDYRAGLSGV